LLTTSKEELWSKLTTTWGKEASGGLDEWQVRTLSVTVVGSGENYSDMSFVGGTVVAYHSREALSRTGAHR